MICLRHHSWQNWNQKVRPLTPWPFHNTYKTCQQYICLFLAVTTIRQEHASYKGCPSPFSRRGRGDTGRGTWCRTPIPSSWIWNTQDAIKSPSSLAVHKQFLFIWWFVGVLWPCPQHVEIPKPGMGLCHSNNAKSLTARPPGTPTNSSFVCWLLYCPLPAYRRKSKVYTRMLL